MDESIRSGSGRGLDELTIDALRAGGLSAEDFRISRAQLDAQADAAAAGGYRQLAENLRRAAELTGLPNERVFEIYAMLRPGRASVAELQDLAADLRRQNMSRVAEFIFEAAEAYGKRGIAKLAIPATPL
jgi:propanediol dehydratase small subunit